MKQISTLFILLLMIAAPLRASQNSSVGLHFQLPQVWEYTSSNDVFVFSVENQGESYVGMLTLCAKNLSGEEFVVFNEEIEIPAESTLESEFCLTDMVDLSVGEYEFFFRYDNGTKTSVENTLVLIQVPSIVNKRIPITTVKGEEIDILRMGSNQISVMSANSINEVEIYNLLGSPMISKKNLKDQQVDLDVSRLQKGVYVLKANLEGKYKSVVVQVY